MLSKLEGRGWLIVEPPMLQDGESVVARYNGEPVKSGFLMDVLSDNEEVFHAEYRSGHYDLEVKIDFSIGRGQVKVTQAPGYDS